MEAQGRARSKMIKSPRKKRGLGGVADELKERERERTEGARVGGWISKYG